MTLSQQRARANSAINGRGGRLAAFTGGARSVNFEDDTAQGMRRAWENQQNVQTYTRTKSGQLSANGRNTRGAYTNSMTPKNDDGSAVIGKNGEVRQSGRSKQANRSQRNYDVRAGMNNITPKAMQAMIDAGLVRVVEGGGLEGSNGNVIRQKANGNFTMGLSNG